MRGTRVLVGAIVTMLAGCGGGGGGGDPPPAPPPNQPPVANAGTDQATIGGGTVTLNGTASSDPDGSVVSFSWAQLSGPAIPLSSSTVVNPVFCAPPVASQTVLTFALTVRDDDGSASISDQVSVTVSPNPGGNVPVSGTISFARVPFHTLENLGLNYASQEQVPARGIAVHAICGASQVVATTRTDATGAYTISVPANTSLAIRASAEMASAAPQMQFRVLDDANANQVYSFTGDFFNAGSSGTASNVSIPSGWSSTGAATGNRAAAPFAILDTVYKALLLLETVDASLDFPALDIDWGPNNDGFQTFYQPGPGTPRIVLSGEANVDTDEYDEHVIAHEFGHYIEDQFSRSDSVGGPHSAGEVLDPRVAFGEGFGYAFGAIVLNASLTRDSVGAGQAQSGSFDVESDAFLPVGWFSESSVWSILWDLFDVPADDADTITLGFAPLWDVLTNGHRDTPAVTSIFPFIAELKLPLSAIEQTQIDQLVESHSIESPMIEPYASTEGNNAGSADVLPIYRNISLGVATPVRSVTEFGEVNKLSNRRFLRFQAPSTRSVSVNVTGPAGQDIDAIVFGRGEILGFGITPTNVENFSFDAVGGETYVIEVYDCANAGCNDTYAPVDTHIDVILN